MVLHKRYSGMQPVHCCMTWLDTSLGQQMCCTYFSRLLGFISREAQLDHLPTDIITHKAR
eukprot:6238124-Amphidinium_carterae.1